MSANQFLRHYNICLHVKDKIQESLLNNWEAFLTAQANMPERSNLDTRWFTAQPNLDPAYMLEDVRIEDITETQRPGYGIIITPESEREQLGTNERDDIDYSVLVTRSVSALKNEDITKRLAFLQDLRLLFHNKHVGLDDTCYLYSQVEQGPVSIPREWQKDNNSISITRIWFLARESRQREADE